MSATFTPLCLENIEEGRFLPDLNKALRAAQAHLIQFQRQHGDKLTEKAKSSVSVKIDMTYHPKGEMFSVAAKLNISQPSRPTVTTIALQADAEDGPALFVRPTGADTTDPRQAKFCTDDGRPTAASEAEAD
jgi:hypothetical protein